MPIWLILFSLIFTTGTYFYKQSLINNIGDEYLRMAANKGRFTTEDIEELIDKVDRLGFDRGDIQVEISPTKALNIGVSKDENEYISLTINPNTKAFISKIFDLITPGTPEDDSIKYYYTRIAKSEEYIN